MIKLILIHQLLGDARWAGSPTGRARIAASGEEIKGEFKSNDAADRYS